VISLDASLYDEQYGFASTADLQKLFAHHNGDPKNDIKLSINLDKDLVIRKENSIRIQSKELNDSSQFNVMVRNR
jgi:hypothetical protein